MKSGSEIQYRVEETPRPEEVADLVTELVAFNATKAVAETFEDLAVFAFGEDGARVGGAAGYTHWSWLFISHLWVADGCRGRGIGSELIRRMEEVAKRRECRRAHLDTYSFQAVGFYRRLGYAEFGRLDDYPTGHTRYFMTRAL